MKYTYRLVDDVINPQIQRIQDGAFIPKDIDNGDYRHYLKWVEAGSPTLEQQEALNADKA